MRSAALSLHPGEGALAERATRHISQEIPNEEPNEPLDNKDDEDRRRNLRELVNGGLDGYSVLLRGAILIEFVATRSYTKAQYSDSPS